MNYDSLKSLPLLKHDIPQFYKDILKHYGELNNTRIKQNPKTFSDIRKQVIWGNQYIKFKGKSLIFKSWINSGIIYINDILDRDGEYKDVIINKLVDKSNWISELSTIKSSIPKKWSLILKSEKSVKSCVNINKMSKFGENITVTKYSNKDIKELFISRKFQSPYIHTFWDTTFKKDINWKYVYLFIHNVLIDNKIKQLKLKIIHRIIPTNENLFIWKQIDTPLCKHCNYLENLEHFFIKCPYLRDFWTTVHNLFKKLNISKLFSLNEIVIGYKYELTEYHEINILINQIIYIIYKCYFISERRTKEINMLKLLYSDMMVLTKYFEKRKMSQVVITKFSKCLRELI
jgi:hypothetical protein